MNEFFSAKQAPQQGKTQLTCDVANCIYNDSNHHCNAKQVKVGPQYAASSGDTICATFKP